MSLRSRKIKKQRVIAAQDWGNTGIEETPAPLARTAPQTPIAPEPESVVETPTSLKKKKKPQLPQ